MKYKNLTTYGLQHIPSNFNSINKINKLRFITDSQNCKRLEQKISKLVKCNYTVVCNNGTSALMMSLLSLQLKEIIAIVPNINFVAIINVLKFLNAKIIISDVNDNGMTDHNKLEECLNFCKKKKIKPNVFIPIHYAGFVLDIKKISKICLKNKIKIIEDGCHSFGSKDLNGNYVGKSKNSLLTTFSFHPVKNITTIEGGAVCTNNKKIYERLCRIKSFNLQKTKISNPYNAIGWGLNFRMGEVNAMLGINQISKLSKFKNRRLFLIKIYKKQFKVLKDYIEIMNNNDQTCFWHLCTTKLKGKLLKNKTNFMQYLKSKGVATQIHYKPISKHKFYKKYLILDKQKNSINFYNKQLTFPLHYKMTSLDILHLVKIIKNFIKYRLS